MVAKSYNYMLLPSVGSCGSIHQVCSSSSSLQDEDQQQQGGCALLQCFNKIIPKVAIRSNLVIGSSGERKDTKQKQRSQNQAAVQEEDQHVIRKYLLHGYEL